MKEITAYKILSSLEEDILNGLVNEYIAEGWQPFGSLAVSMRPGCLLYSQAIVTYAVEEEEDSRVGAT